MLLVVMISAIGTFFVSGLNTTITIQSHGEAIRTAQVALDRVSRDLREAIPNAEASGSDSGIIDASATTITFYADLSRTPTGSGRTPSTQKIRYALVSDPGNPGAGLLTRQVQNPTSVSPLTFVGAPAWSTPAPIASGIDLSKSDFGVFGVVADTPATTDITGPTIPLPVSATGLDSIASVHIHLGIRQRTGASITTVEVNSDVLLRNRALQ